MDTLNDVAWIERRTERGQVKQIIHFDPVLPDIRKNLEKTYQVEFIPLCYSSEARKQIEDLKKIITPEPLDGPQS